MTKPTVTSEQAAETARHHARLLSPNEQEIFILGADWQREALMRESGEFDREAAEEASRSDYATEYSKCAIAFVKGATYQHQQGQAKIAALKESAELNVAFYEARNAELMVSRDKAVDINKTLSELLQNQENEILALREENEKLYVVIGNFEKQAELISNMHIKRTEPSALLRESLEDLKIWKEGNFRYLSHETQVQIDELTKYLGEGE